MAGTGLFLRQRRQGRTVRGRTADSNGSEGQDGGPQAQEDVYKDNLCHPSPLEACTDLYSAAKKL